jgi:pyruvate/2-oxoglutarate dehydrogenase complex dihydrolipoamide dehydrogenase (E3) component/uncharacterized membrane protein YdjX (TVP38/TMEM64 family)
MSPTRARALLLGFIVAAVAAFFILDFDRYLTVESMAARRDEMLAYRAAQPRATALAFLAAYIAMAAVSLPGASLLTLAGGAIFGLGLGTVLVSFASSIGATLAFLSARFVFRDWVQARLGHRLQALNEGVRRDGAHYLLTLRLLPIFPFWVINLVLGLTPMRTWTFYWASQLGMLPATVIYVYAGTQLAQFRVGPGLVLALALLAVFTLAAGRAVRELNARRAYRPWRARRPERYDYNVVVIGAGSAGLVASYIAAATKARVALVEKHRMGGDCLNTGCVPSKALIRSSKLLAQMARARDWGIGEARATVSFSQVMDRVARVIAAIEPHDSPERYTQLGVDVRLGTATLTSPWTVEVRSDAGTETLRTRSIVIAAGSRPAVPALPGLNEAGYLTSDTVWDLRELPRRLVVLGGGPVGCELAQAFARLGSKVTLVEAAPRILGREDPEASALLRERFAAEGIDVRTGCEVLRVSATPGGRGLHVRHDGRDAALPFDALLVALGRVANTEGYGLEGLGIDATATHTLETNAFLQTRYPNIYACGDVAGPYQFTHVASHQAWYATVNALFGSLRRFKVNYRAVPWAIFTDPQVARVGLSEEEAQQAGTRYQAATYRLDDLDRAIADGETQGFVKVLTRPGTDAILGATCVGSHAAETIAEFVLAMTHGLGLNKVLGTIHVYPTFAEANKQAAGLWRRGAVTAEQERLLAAFHAWQRGAGDLKSVLYAVPGALGFERR